MSNQYAAVDLVKDKAELEYLLGRLDKLDELVNKVCYLSMQL